MSYFSSQYDNISYPIGDDTTAGLRNAQLGAIHAIAAHFSLYDDEPALIVMPTGSGKTAVMNLSAYLLRAERVLVISSTVLVRGQIVEEFSTLRTLKELGVFPDALDLPKVKEIKSPIKSADEWNSLREFDAVIGIPNSINVGINELLKPPENLFDLILVDEAHHVPAFTWTNTIQAFTNSKRAYFTATPFRRDKKEIEGRLAYSYPLAKAYEDKIFGDIGYYPVKANDADADLAIALAAQRVMEEDKANGLDHYVMVRTESKDHAEQLLDLYSKKTALKLKKVDSTLSYRTIKKVIEQLKAKELDGIICVDMLGEGFDFPNLKIAAIHRPKKSLAATLQFIGRFARTNAENIGQAKFLAIPSDIEIGKKKLYQEGAIWSDIIKDLSDEAVLEEDETKRMLDTFEQHASLPSEEGVSFYNLNPYCHVKIYRADGMKFDDSFDIFGQEIVYHAISREYNSIVLITRVVEKPKWVISDDLLDVQHNFFLFFYDTETQLLFINSSTKTRQFYDNLVEQIAVGVYERIAKHDINKVLVDIEETEFFSIGMQNRSPNSGESYLTVAGSNAENRIRKSLGRLYSNGHIFARGKTNGTKVTIGYSSASKVWSNAYERIPAFIKWCQELGKKITSNKVVKTNTGFDNLPIGRVVDHFPLPAHSATWNGQTFSDAPFLLVPIQGGGMNRYQLLDFDIEIDRAESDSQRLLVRLSFEDFSILLHYDFQDHFHYVDPDGPIFDVEIGGINTPLDDYLNESPLQIYLEDLAAIMNHEYFEPPPSGERFEGGRIIAYDWAATNTDIKREFYRDEAEKEANQNKNSIHETLQEKLYKENFPILIYDHGSGEIADFVCMRDIGGQIEVNLYHVKGSQGDEPGDRVNDVYEVCMQAVKSTAWVKSKHSFKEKVRDRVGRNPAKFIAGDIASFNALLDLSRIIDFKFTIVQPGISAQTLSEKISTILAATDDAIVNSGYNELIVLGS